MLLPITLSVGAAVDYAQVASARSLLQQAVDSAAIAAARNHASTLAARQQIATSTVVANLGDWASRLNPTINETEPSAGVYKVVATAAVTTSIMKLARVDSVPISARATAAFSTPPNPNSVCLLALSKTATPGFLANSNVNISSSTCEFHVASAGNPAATFNSGNTFNMQKLCVAGAQVLNNEGSIPALNTGCATAPDPFAGTLPAVTVGACTVSNQNYSGAVTLSPGVYCGNFNFNGTGTVNFQPGLYIIKGANWNMNTGWTMNGSGVTFYFADTSYMQINSGVTANLTAPTSGTYSDILMFEAPGLATSSFSINGQAGHSFQGLIYLPSRNVTFNSMSSVTAEALTIIVNAVILNTLNWNIKSSARVIPASGGAQGTLRLTN